MPDLGLQGPSYHCPKGVCVARAIEITQVKCGDEIENGCFNVAKFTDATNTNDQKKVIIGEPSCKQITLISLHNYAARPMLLYIMIKIQISPRFYLLTIIY